MFCFVFCSLLIMPQTVSPVDPIPSPPSAKIPAGGTLWERRGTPVSLWHAGMALLCPQDRQGDRQPGWEWRGARDLDTQEEDPEGDEDNRLLGRDTASFAPGPEGRSPQLRLMPVPGSDLDSPSPHLMVQRVPVIRPYSTLFRREIFL